MRRLLLLVTLLVSVPAGAGAEGAPRQAWSNTGAVPVLSPAAGRLYVAAVGGAEQARAFVAVDGAAGPATLTLAEVRAESALAETATIAVCPLTLPLVEGSTPTANCTAPLPMARAADGTWSVRLEAWPEHGVAVAPLLASPTTTFSLAFDPARTAVQLAPSTSPAPDTPATAPAPAPEPLLDSPSAPVIAPEAAPPVESAPPVSLPVRAGRAAAAVAGRVLSAASPPAAVVLPLVAVLAVGLLWLVGRRSANSPASTGDTPVRRASSLIGAVALVLVPLLFSEASVYKLGLVLIMVAGAIGLHLLVNWAGELSLAHATLLGLPAFTVAKLSADHGWSPVVLLPVGVVVGLAAGAFVGLPALRARGLQVALVTLAAGVAIDRFFLTREWVTGPAGGSQVSTPTLGPFTFSSAKALYPLLAVLVAASVVVAWVIFRSRLGRGLLWVKAQPDAAAAFGVPVARYRATAYALAGAYAGFAGGLTAMWVGRLTPEAFPLSRSFTYLIIVALAGRGFVGGVAVAALAVEGGRLFLASGDAFVTYGARSDSSSPSPVTAPGSTGSAVSSPHWQRSVP